MLVDSMIEDQDQHMIEDQQGSRQTSLVNLNIDVLMKDEEFSGGWCDADYVLAAKKDARPSGITPSYSDKVGSVRFLINVIWSLLTR
jgi:hypothetical protein